MELRVLRYFLTIAEEENITRAADILHVTQPTLSRQMMQLEDELGTKLFKRGKYCMKLTEDGLFLKRRAEEILSLAENTAEAIGNKDKDIAGEITIGCTETHSMDILASKMVEFRKLHSGVSYNVYTTNADGIKENMLAGVWHPSFREICEEYILTQKIKKTLDEHGRYGEYYYIKVNPKDISKLTGRGNSGIKRLQNMGYNIRIQQDKKVKKGNISFERVDRK